MAGKWMAGWWTRQRGEAKGRSGDSSQRGKGPPRTTLPAWLGVAVEDTQLGKVKEGDGGGHLHSRAREWKERPTFPPAHFGACPCRG